MGSTKTSPTVSPSHPVTPLSMTDEEEEGYFTASERDSIGPATPARNGRDRIPGSKASDGGAAADTYAKEGRPASITDQHGGEESPKLVLAHGDVPSKKVEESPTKGGLMAGLGLRGMMGKLGL